MIRHISLVTGPLLMLIGCMPQSGSALFDDLKGKWAATDIATVRYALLTTPPPTPPEQNPKAVCHTEYVTFDKQGILMHFDGKPAVLFRIQEVKRDGPAIALKGDAPVPGGASATLHFVVGKGTVRFDDIADSRGRSIRYDRLGHDGARRVNITSINQVFSTALNLKACA